MIVYVLGFSGSASMEMSSSSSGNTSKFRVDSHVTAIAKEVVMTSTAMTKKKTASFVTEEVKEEIGGNFFLKKSVLLKRFSIIKIFAS